MKKRWYAVPCAVLLSFSMLTNTAISSMAEEIATSVTEIDAAYSGTCGEDGDNVTWNYDPDTETLTFSGTGTIKDYLDDYIKRSISPPWVVPGRSIMHVVYEEGITDVGELFYGLFPNYHDEAIRQTVTFSESVWKCETIEIPIKGSDSLTPPIFENFLIYAPYGSRVYYNLIIGENYFDQFVPTGVANRPVYRTDTYNSPGNITGANGNWTYDYVTQVLSVYSNDQTIVSIAYVGADSPYPKPVRSVYFHSDVVFPVDLISATGDYNLAVYEWLETGYDIYYEAGCNFGELYNEMPDDIRAQTAGHVFCVEDSGGCYGDIDLDGQIDLTDAVFLSKVVAYNVTTLSELQQQNADVNIDGTIDSGDSLILLRYLVHLENTLPYTD